MLVAVLAAVVVILGSVVLLRGDNGGQGGDSPLDTMLGLGEALARGDCSAASEYAIGSALDDLRSVENCAGTGLDSIEIVSESNSEAVVTAYLVSESGTEGTPIIGTFHLVRVSGDWKVSSLEFDLTEP